MSNQEQAMLSEDKITDFRYGGWWYRWQRNWFMTPMVTGFVIGLILLVIMWVPLPDGTKKIINSCGAVIQFMLFASMIYFGVTGRAGRAEDEECYDTCREKRKFSGDQ